MHLRVVVAVAGHLEAELGQARFAVVAAIPVRLVEFSTDTDTLAGRGSCEPDALGLGQCDLAEALPVVAIEDPPPDQRGQQGEARE